MLQTFYIIFMGSEEKSSVRVGAGVDEGGDQADRVELREFIQHVCSVQELEQEEEVTTDFVQTLDSTHLGTIL